MRQPPRWGNLAELVGLCTLALGQPLLDLLGRSPSVFTFADASGFGAWAVVLGVVVVPVVVLWATQTMAGLVGARSAVHLACVTGLVAVVAVQWGKRLLGPGTTVALGAAGVALLFAVLHDRSPEVRSWARVLSVLAPVVVLLFAFSASGELLRAGSAETAAFQDTSDVDSVVLIVLDEFPTASLLGPDGGVDPVRFPNIAAFADTATWYRNATSLSPTTRAAVPSILTGQDPRLDEPIWTNYPDSLFSLLAPTHRLTVFESVTQLCGSDRCGELPAPPVAEDVVGRAPPEELPAVSDQANRRPTVRLLGEVVDLAIEQIDPFATGEVHYDQFQEIGLIEAIPNVEEMSRPERLETFAESFRPHDEPVFYFLHLVLPHSPWVRYAGGESYIYRGVEQFEMPEGTGAGPWVAALSEQRHLLQAQYTDLLLGEVVEAMEASGDFDDSLVIVTADHGATFQLGRPIRNTEPGMFRDVAYVPLLVKEAGQTEGRVDTSNAYSTDIAPTVANLLGVPIDWDVDGAPLGSAEVNGRDTIKYAFDMPLSGETRERFLRGRLTYDIADTAPSVDDRWIGPIAAGERDLAGLDRVAGVEDLVGRDLGELSDGGARAASTVARVPTARFIVEPERVGLGSPGLVQGVLDDPPADAVSVLLTVDGTVVSGGPIFELGEHEHSFALVMPEGSWFEPGPMGVALVFSDGAVAELEMTGW